MRRQTLLTLLTAGMLVLAGCAGSTGGDGSPTAEDTTAPDTELDDSDGDGAGSTATGTVQFYVSDDPGQIEDFRHLNVTISQIGFKRAGGAADGLDNESDDEETENETEMDDEETAESPDNGTETAEEIEDGTNETTASLTATDGGVAVEPGAANHGGDNQTASGDTTAANETDSDDEMAGNESDSDDGMDANETESDDEMDDAESEAGDGWITHNVSSRSVDLTQLRGDNATLIDSPELPAGNYSKVFVYVSDINATLTDGTSVNVKLPSNKLQLNKGFRLEPNGTVSFVYDITVFKAGNSGKYILKPVISQSGADQNVNDVGDSGMDDEDEPEEDEETDESGTDDTTAATTAEKGGPPEDRGPN